MFQKKDRIKRVITNIFYGSGGGRYRVHTSHGGGEGYSTRLRCERKRDAVVRRMCYSKVLSGSPANRICSLALGCQGGQLCEGRTGRNERDLHDKSTSLGPALLVKTVSYTKEGKGRKETKIDNESTTPGPRRQTRTSVIRRDIRRKGRDELEASVDTDSKPIYEADRNVKPKFAVGERND